MRKVSVMLLTTATIAAFSSVSFADDAVQPHAKTVKKNGGC